MRRRKSYPDPKPYRPAEKEFWMGARVCFKNTAFDCLKSIQGMIDDGLATERTRQTLKKVQHLRIHEFEEGVIIKVVYVTVRVMFPQGCVHEVPWWDLYATTVRPPKKDYELSQSRLEV